MYILEIKKQTNPEKCIADFVWKNEVFQALFFSLFLKVPDDQFMETERAK